MNEVEVKFLDVDATAVARKLISLGAKKTFEGDIIPSYFDFPDRQLKARGQLLRLRKRGSMVELTFKQKMKHPRAKIAEETELLVDDFEQMRKILLKIGLLEWKKYSKKRTSYCLGNAHYELDKYPGMPTFLEVEANNIKALKKAVQAIGFSIKDAKPWSGREVFEHYKRH
jgi:adenylate cyclase, class 2